MIGKSEEIYASLNNLPLQTGKAELIWRLFFENFGDGDHTRFVAASAPGRVEIAGNHTDHQGGRVITAGIDLRSYGFAALNGTDVIHLAMDGFGTAELDLGEAGWEAPLPEEYETSIGILRGMTAAYSRRGGHVAGFDMVTTSDVPSGMGLSSSASFEMLIGATLEALDEQLDHEGEADNDDHGWSVAYAEAAMVEDEVVDNAVTDKTSAAKDKAASDEGMSPRDPVELALAGMRVEQHYFGKACGAQDQLASACGGAVGIDFAEATPVIHPVPFDAKKYGYTLCLIDSHFDHANFSDEYSSVPIEMTEVARALGGERLCEVQESELFASFGRLREQLGDGVVMRALHYYDECHRVDLQREALENGDFEAFVEQVRLSGASSAQFLQNVSPHGGGKVQPCMVILALCQHFLGARGAWRIHGGGFGGSTLALVPTDVIDDFTAFINDILGYEACLLVNVDPRGAWAKRIM